PHEIVGVIPETFNDWRHLGWVDVFRPLALTDDEAADRDATLLNLFGRPAPERSLAEASGFIAAFGEHLAATFPETHAGTAWAALPLQDGMHDGGVAPTIAMLVGLSAFVVLIACPNLANFMLARTIARAREFAVRAALGASRAQLLRPLLLESFLLAVAG